LKSTKHAILCRPTYGPSFGYGHDFTLWDGTRAYAYVGSSYVDKLGRGTEAFVSTGTEFQRLEVGLYEVWAAAGRPTPCA
jgi:hypothetical protein